ncbi:MAG: response regulator [Limnohabitans sp.]|jgi:DNA-binding response OmpR family regulator|uniref:response regulator transcription factor n=1 Tax=Limnohabitans sp. TaxID=1907725 RepID=UPI0025CC8C09|nr:response regulator [Limnohabitans sp.]MCO4090300.1 response regulator [Limnohabitans sp.]
MAIKVLIVDDDPNLLVSLNSLPRREGYEVHMACDGQEAMEALAKLHPARVVLDVTMPRKNGDEVCAAVRVCHECDDIQIMMLSAKGREADIAKGLTLGANACMTQPFSTQGLTQKVAQMLQAVA